MKVSRGVIIVSIVILILLVLTLFSRITGFVNMTEVVHTCYDSDFGQNYTVPGTVTGIGYNYAFFAARSFSEQDRCESTFVLREYYCVQKGINLEKEFTRYKCSEGCYNGACNGIATRCSGWCLFK
jgi:hypothetical protein